MGVFLGGGCFVLFLFFGVIEFSPKIRKQFFAISGHQQNFGEQQGRNWGEASEAFSGG